MRKMAVTGGKGGVGKSTVTVLLANKLRAQGKSLVLADLDVECPNDFLLLGQSLGQSVQEVKAKFPEIDPEKCWRCGECVKQCYSHAIFQVPGQVPTILPELCSGCGLCWRLCPAGAITQKEKVIGQIFENKVEDNFWLVTGETYGIVEESGPIVSQTKEYAQRLAEKIKADFLVIDTAVGLHCGVIRALMGADQVYAVTEPTRLGAHDLQLILALLEKLKLPAQIVLNQADLGERQLIDEISQREGVKIGFEIPYSSTLAQAYAQGRLREINLLEEK